MTLAGQARIDVAGRHARTDRNHQRVAIDQVGDLGQHLVDILGLDRQQDPRAVGGHEVIGGPGDAQLAGELLAPLLANVGHHDLVRLKAT